MPKPSPRILRADAQRAVARMRAAIERDADTYGALSLVVDGLPTTGRGTVDWGRVALPTTDDGSELSAGTPADDDDGPGLGDDDDEPAAFSLSTLASAEGVAGVRAFRLAARDSRAKRTARAEATDAGKALFREQTADLVARYHAGTLSPSAFQTAVRGLVKDVHLTAAVAGNDGGWEGMTKADWGRVGRTIRDQYAFLDTRVRAFERARGKGALPSADAIRAKVDMYADAASQSRSKQEVAARGFDPSVLPAHPGDGSTECRSRCGCAWEVTVLSIAAGNWNVRWARAKSDSCTTCIARASKWKRLAIRGGKLTSSASTAGTMRDGDD